MNADRHHRRAQRARCRGRSASRAGVLTAPTVGPLLALLLAMAFFSLKSDRFLQAQNLSLVLQQVMVVGVLAIGQTLVILTAGIDLSCRDGDGVRPDRDDEARGRERRHAAPGDPARHPRVRRLRRPERRPRDGRAAAGVHRHARHAQHRVRADPHLLERPDVLGSEALPSELLFFGRTFTIGGTDFTYGVVLMFVLYALAWYALTQTAWGRHVYAVGDNPEAARLTGIKTDRVLLSVYTVAGLTYGIAALLLVARTELGDPNAGQTTENLDAITAVVLGGTSLFGGRGTVIGTLIGAIIVGVFRNGLTLIGVEVDLPVPRHRASSSSSPSRSTSSRTGGGCERSRSRSSRRAGSSSATARSSRSTAPTSSSTRARSSRSSATTAPASRR